jgi:hypothetical protein
MVRLYAPPPAFAKTCRKIRHELLSVIYGRHTYEMGLDDTKLVEERFSYIFDMLRKVKLMIPVVEKRESFIQLRYCWIQVSKSDFRSLMVGPRATSIYGDAYCVCGLEKVAHEARITAFLESKDPLLVLCRMLRESPPSMVYPWIVCPCRQSLKLQERPSQSETL